MEGVVQALLSGTEYKQMNAWVCVNSLVHVL